MKTDLSPKISVIMGIYNCANTLPDAIDCIVNQTYTDWELIMCDDGSSDRTLEIAEQYAMKYPRKIIVLKNDSNKGLNFTLNKCLKNAKGQFIARMDGDDVCALNRFELEVDVLEKEKNISIVSSDMSFFDENGTWGKVSYNEYPQPKDFIHGSQFCHAGCMVKKEAYDAVNGYSEGKKFLRVEDYHLWVKMYAAGFRGKNIHETLYMMRDDRNAYARRKFKYRLNESYVMRYLIKQFHLPIRYYALSLRPIIVGLLPKFLYDKLHKRKLNKENDT